MLLRVDRDAGHTSFDATREQSNLNIADTLAFALWQTGDPDLQPEPTKGDRQQKSCS